MKCNVYRTIMIILNKERVLLCGLAWATTNCLCVSLGRGPLVCELGYLYGRKWWALDHEWQACNHMRKQEALLVGEVVSSRFDGYV